MRQPTHRNFGLTPRLRAEVERERTSYKVPVLGGLWKDAVRSVISFVQIEDKDSSRIGFDKLAALTWGMVARGFTPRQQPALVPVRPFRMQQTHVPGSRADLHLR